MVVPVGGLIAEANLVVLATLLSGPRPGLDNASTLALQVTGVVKGQAALGQVTCSCSRRCLPGRPSSGLQVIAGLALGRDAGHRGCRVLHAEGFTTAKLAEFRLLAELPPGWHATGGWMGARLAAASVESARTRAALGTPARGRCRWRCTIGANAMSAVAVGSGSCSAPALRFDATPDRRPGPAAFSSRHSSALAKAGLFLRGHGVQCGHVELDLTRSVDVLDDEGTGDLPPQLLHQLLFWAALLSSEATTVAVRGCQSYPKALAKVFRALPPAPPPAEPPEGRRPAQRFLRRFLEAARRTDLAALRRSSMEWSVPFRLALAGEEEALGDAAGLPRDLRYSLWQPVVEKGSVCSVATVRAWRQMGMHQPLMHLFAEITTVICAIAAETLHTVFPMQEILIVARDSSVQWLAEDCPIIWRAFCTYLDASKVQPSDLVDPTRLIAAVLQGKTPRFVILLPLGTLPPTESDIFSAHPYGDMMLLNLVHQILTHSGSRDDRFLIHFMLARDSVFDQIIVEDPPSGKQRFVQIAGLSRCLSNRGPVCGFDRRTLYVYHGWTVRGAGSWVAESLDQASNASAYSLWGCSGCRDFGDFATRVALQISSPKHHFSAPARLRVLADAGGPLWIQHANVVMGYPGSGNTLLRLLLEVVSGRPVHALGFPDTSMAHSPSFCFPDAGLLRRVDAEGSPVAWGTHSDHGLLWLDLRSVRSLVVIVRDYADHVTQIREANEISRRFADDYLGILDFYDRCTLPKKLVYYEDLVARPDQVAALLADFYALPERAAGLERWREGRAGLFEELAACKAETSAELPATCGWLCDKFATPFRRGPRTPGRALRDSRDLVQGAGRELCRRAPQLTNSYLRPAIWNSGIPLPRCNWSEGIAS